MADTKREPSETTFRIGQRVTVNRSFVGGRAAMSRNMIDNYPAQIWPETPMVIEVVFVDDQGVEELVFAEHPGYFFDARAFNPA